MRKFWILGSLLIAGMAHAEDSTREVPAFTAIKCRCAFNLSVEVGKTQSITLKGDDKFNAKVLTEVAGNELIISYKDKNSIKIKDDAQVIVTLPSLSRFRMEGAGVARINNINSDDVEISYEGAGMLTAAGKVKNLRLKAQGVGMVDTKDLLTERADVSVEGIGSVSVHAKEKLSASVQGIGSLTYYGHPRNLSKSVDGIGSIKAGD